MNYDGLPDSYWRSQAERVETLRAKIATRASIPFGRLIPDDTDLAIGTGRRLPLTVMFIDISSFSERRALTADEQEMNLRVLNLFLTEMIRIVEDYGGNVEKNTGDGLMAYFEDSPASEGANSTKKAVTCALTMHAANEYLIAPILRASNVSPLQFRVSMDHGEITIARIGAAQRFNANVAVGNAANFAAKMLGLTKAGEVSLGASAWSRLPEAWKLNWTELAPVSTGWVYDGSERPYPLYLYTGRWIRLI